MKKEKLIVFLFAFLLFAVTSHAQEVSSKRITERRTPTPKNTESIEGVRVATLKKKLDGSYHVLSDCNLYLQYREEYVDRALTYNIYKDPKYLLVKNQNDFPVPVKYGHNQKLKINFGVNGLCLGGGLYILEIIDAKGAKTYLRVKVPAITCAPCAISNNPVD